MKIISLLILSCLATTGQAQNDFVNDYLEATRQTMHGQSVEKDVLNLTSMYHEDVVYEHPKAGFKLETKAVIEKGKLSFLNSYGGSLSDTKIRLIKSMQNASTYVLEFEIQFLTSKNESIKRTQIQVLEVENQKIKRIIDYW